MRVYYINAEGISLGADEFIGGEKDEVWGEIEKRTKGVFNISQG